MANTSTFSIYQIRPGTKLEDYRIMNYDYMISHGLWIEQDAYSKFFEGALEDRTLDSIYEEFNLRIPVGFKGHSLSVSDVIVIHEKDAERAYYVDSIGFKEVKGFFSSTDLNWIETDPDCAQHCRRFSVDALSYEFVQIIELPDEKCFISRAVIDVRDYDEKDILDIIQTYGFESFENFVASCDGEFEWRLIAEMIFESGALETISEGPFETYQRAKEKVMQQVSAQRKE